MSGSLAARVGAAPDRAPDPAIATFAAQLGEEAGALAVLFYGSNLRTGSLEGLLDFYLLLPGPRESGLWPRVYYRERDYDGSAGAMRLRAKVAALNLATFAAAARGETVDTTIWARFVQPRAVVWSRDPSSAREVTAALAAATRTAARLAVVLGPHRGPEDEFWRALFRATYRAELRVEPAGREEAILAGLGSHFDGLLPAALSEAGIPFSQDRAIIEPKLDPDERRRILRWWNRRRRLGKLLNTARLARAMTTFEGGMRYAAWKVERHTGMPVKVTPLRERFPAIAAPGVLWLLWRSRRRSRAPG